MTEIDMEILAGRQAEGRRRDWERADVCQHCKPHHPWHGLPCRQRTDRGLCPCPSALPGAHVEGLCAGMATADLDLWFSSRPADVELAKSICADCPIAAACLAGARERDEPCGTWGGVTFPEMAEPDWPVAPVHIPSRAAYVQGCHCPDCTAENTRWIAEWRTRRHDSPPPVREPLPEQLTFDLAVTTQRSVTV